MAKDKKLRSVNTKFWDDSYVIELDPIEKLLFLYLLTNPLTNILGIYEVSIRRIAFDTGIDREMVLKIFERFKRDKKLEYHNNYVIMFNFMKNQKFNPSMKQGAESLYEQLPDSIKTVCVQGGYRVGQVEVEVEVEDKEESKVLFPKKRGKEKTDIPTIQDCKSFFKDNNINGAEAEKFFKYNQKRGWKIGNQKIADWKLVAEGWIKNIEEPAAYVSDLRKFVKKKIKEVETKEQLEEMKQKAISCDDWNNETKDEQAKILRVFEDKWTYDLAFRY